MSSFAQQILDATYGQPYVDDGRVTPAEGGQPFGVRIIPLGGDETLGVGLQSQPVLGTHTHEVRKTQWAQPEPEDAIEILSDVDGSVIKRLIVIDDPLSLDDKRLTWTLNCKETEQL